MIDNESCDAVNSGIIAANCITGSMDEFVTGGIFIDIVADNHCHVGADPCHKTDMQGVNLSDCGHRNEHTDPGRIGRGVCELDLKRR